MKRYKLLSAVGLYASFLLIGHHGPVSAHAHQQQPLVVPAPEGTQEPSGSPQVLGATTTLPVLFYNPVNNIYESPPSNLKQDEIIKLWACIDSQHTRDIASFEKCYANLYPKAVLLDNGHTHKKHSLKFIKDEEEHSGFKVKHRKHQPHTA